ncbi:Casparian strip membrane protein 3 [Linum perenne]
MKPSEPAAAELAPGAGAGSSPPIRDDVNRSQNREVKRGISILDLMARFLAAAGTLGSAIAMGTTNETVTVASFSQVFQFNTKFNDLPVFTFFVVANSVVGSYLVLSFPMSVFHIIRSSAKTSRIILVSLDTVRIENRESDAVNTDSRSLISSSHGLLGTQGKYQYQLVCNLPAIRRLLPPHFWIPRRIFRCHTLVHRHGHCFFCVSLSTLSQLVKLTELFLRSDRSTECFSNY